MTVSRVIRSIPFLSGLPDLRPEDHRSALFEVGMAVLFSVLPIALSVLLSLFASERFLGFSTEIASNVSRGELFLYANAMLAPLMCYVLSDYEGVGGLPSRISFGIATVVVLLITTIFFAVDRAGLSNWWQGQSGRSAAVVWFSFFTYLVTIFLNYLAQAYKRLIDSGAPSIQRRQETDLRKDLEKLRNKDERRG